MNNELCNNFRVVCPIVNDGFHICVVQYATIVRSNENLYEFKITLPY